MPVKKLAVDVIAASTDASVKLLAQTMLDEDLGDLVITEDDKPVGSVTDRDIDTGLAVAGYDDLSGLTAEATLTLDLLALCLRLLVAITNYERGDNPESTVTTV